MRGGGGWGVDTYVLAEGVSPSPRQLLISSYTSREDRRGRCDREESRSAYGPGRSPKRTLPPSEGLYRRHVRGSNGGNSPTCNHNGRRRTRALVGLGAIRVSLTFLGDFPKIFQVEILQRHRDLATGGAPAAT